VPKGMQQKTGRAPIKMVGHTASNSYGSDPSKQRRGVTSARELKAK